MKSLFYFLLVIPVGGFAQVLEFDNMGTSAVTVGGTGYGKIYWPPGRTRVMLSAYLVANMPGPSAGYVGLDLTHDWVVYYDSSSFSETSYPIGTVDSTTGAGMLSTVYSAIDDAYIHNEYSQIADYTTGVGSGISQSESILAISNAIVQASRSSVVATNSAGVLWTVLGDSSVQTAFNDGLGLGALVVAGVFGFTFMRSIPGDGREDM